MREVDVAIVGAGAAGLSLAWRLCAPARAAHRPPSVLLLNAPPGSLRPPERTWCFWEGPGGGDFDSILEASWDQLRVRSAEGDATAGRLYPLRYKMLRSRAFEEFVDAHLAAAGTVHRAELTVESVHDVSGGAEVRGRDPAGKPVSLRARWVFDSRQPSGLPPARTTLLQHFRGWFVRADRPVFDPLVADLMDFRVRQPGHGLSFGYALPLGPHEALLEYTEFSREVLRDDGYEQALRHYAHEVLQLDSFEVAAVEQGVIPMTDARFPRRAGRSVVRIGTAGGATRPSTGYTFAAVQRQTQAIANALRAGRSPVPPPPHSRRARSMDAVLLRALDTGRVDGAGFFTGLFRDVPPARLLRFLDGRSGMWEDICVGARTPVMPMLRTVAELPWLARCRTPRHLSMPPVNRTNGREGNVT